MFGRQWKSFEVQLRKLITTIIRCGVDTQAKAVCKPQFWDHLAGRPSSYLANSLEEFTATEYFFNGGYATGNGLGKHVPFYTDLVEQGMIDSVSRYHFEPWSVHLLQRHVEVAEALD